MFQILIIMEDFYQVIRAPVTYLKAHFHGTNEDQCEDFGHFEVKKLVI